MKDKPLPLKELLDKLGYVDPCPDMGKHNKLAIRKRARAIKALNIKQFMVGQQKVQEFDGYTFKPLYRYDGVLYS